jgi:putative glutamine amidotransferase
MSARIAIPEPSSDSEYNQRSLSSYIASLHSAGATPILVPLHERPDRIARLLSTTHGVLLPGSRFDADPQRYGENPIPACNPADPARTAVDELLLQDAFNLYKPICGICQGMQNLNVWCNGSLIQDLPSILHTPVNHSPGRGVAEAHPVVITPGTRLASIAASVADAPPYTPPLRTRLASLARKVQHPAHAPSPSIAEHARGELWVNSSHHQAVRNPGDNLRVAAVSPQDKVIEAVELDSPDHWVVAVQWHPERTYTSSALSRAIFAAFIHAVQAWQPRRIEVSVAAS